MTTQRFAQSESLSQDPTMQQPPLCPRGSLSQPDSKAATATAATADAIQTYEQSSSIQPQEHSQSGQQQQDQHPHVTSHEPLQQSQEYQPQQQQPQNPPQTSSLTTGPTATAPFLKDFSLVSEAAKRAQVAVVMRDLESVTLS